MNSSSDMDVSDLSFSTANITDFKLISMSYTAYKIGACKDVDRQIDRQYRVIEE